MTMANSSYPVMCPICQQPVYDVFAYIGNIPYHRECLLSMRWYKRSEPDVHGCRPLTPLSEDDVRRIVREEFSPAMPDKEFSPAMHDNAPLICPFCDEGALTPSTFGDHIKRKSDGLWVRVIALECYNCLGCGVKSIRPDQARRNDQRYRVARLS